MNVKHSALLLPVMVICATYTPIAAGADGVKQDTATITAAYAARDIAADKADADGVVACYSPDFVSYDVKSAQTGMSKAEILTNMKTMFSRATSISSKSVITNIVFDKTGATVFVTEDGAISIAIKGKQHNLTVDGTYKDNWLESKGVWTEKVSHALTETRMLDGAPMADASH